jgi:2-dehydro-3-deoxyphosphogluconate aldolase/(4S)-4-hydroxy-2-oxoglutarate aldolase
VGGSWIVPADAMTKGEWSRITQLAKDTQALRK